MDQQKLNEIVEAYSRFFKQNPSPAGNMKKVILGLPTGNLNRTESNRGCTSELLRLAGYTVEGYNPRQESEKPRFIGEENWLQVCARKPSELLMRMNAGMFNALIAGQDLIFEHHCLNHALNLIELEARRKSTEPIHLPLEEEFPRSHPFGFTQKYEVLKWTKDYLLECNRSQGKIKKYHKFLRATKGHFPQLQSNYQKTMNLGYGKVDLCWGMKSEVLKSLKEDPQELEDRLGKLYPAHTLYISTEYPGIVMRELVESIPETKIEIFGMRYRNPLPEELSHRSIPQALSYVVLFVNKGKSEHINNLGEAAIVFDCRASGESFNANGIEQIGPSLIKDSVANLVVDTGSKYSLFPGLNADQETLDEFLLKNFSDPWNANTEEFKRKQFSNLSRFKRLASRVKSTLKHSGYDYLDSQNMGTLDFEYTAYTQLKMAEFAFRLKAASLEYGKTRRDSIYYKNQ